MNEVYLRLILLKDNKVFEVSFDSRLTFRENLDMFDEIEQIDTKGVNIYDEERQLFLNMDIPLSDMKMARFAKFYLL